VDKRAKNSKLTPRAQESDFSVRENAPQKGENNHKKVINKNVPCASHGCFLTKRAGLFL
jgi:hypothetical protein